MIILHVFARFLLLFCWRRPSPSWASGCIIRRLVCRRRPMVAPNLTGTGAAIGRWEARLFRYLAHGQTHSLQP